jgi:hypothetical protein
VEPATQIRAMYVGAATRVVAGMVGIVMPLAGCGLSPSTSRGGASIAPDDAPPASVPAQTGERPPIPPAVLRELAEGHEEWSRPRKARCPRQLPDRHEDMDRYPAISVLQGLNFITVADGTARGMYVKNMQITDAGRLALGGDLEETADWYVVTVARREYLPGFEKFEIQPDRDRLVAYFRWRWRALNPLGERLNLRPPSSSNDYYDGFATYTHAAGGWTLEKVYLNGEGGDF